MMTTLTLTSLILVQQITALAHHGTKADHLFKLILLLGALLISFTGVFPEYYDANGMIYSWTMEFYHMFVRRTRLCAVAVCCSPSFFLEECFSFALYLRSLPLSLPAHSRPPGTPPVHMRSGLLACPLSVWRALRRSLSTDS